MPCVGIWPPGSACSELCTRAARTGTGLTATEGRCLMRVAVLADIHGNLPALEAVLFDIEAAGVDVIVLNGDIADGPIPAQTLDRLEELGEQAIWVLGHTDRSLAAAVD